jgi:hypothetical protein
MFIPDPLLGKTPPAEKLANLFWRAHHHVREAVRTAVAQRSRSEMSRVAGQAEADTIYGIDVVAESAFLEFLSRHQNEAPPFLLAGEFEAGEAIPYGKGQPEFRVLLDPVDGTRLLMYGKSSGWILTGIAPENGGATRLSDIFFALQTELPLAKHLYADILWASRFTGASGVRENLITGELTPIRLSPDTAIDLQHGFVSFVKLFPRGKQLLAALEEEFLYSALGRAAKDPAAVFEDQHLSTGGQLYALMTGQLRMVADLRPLLNLRWRQQNEPTVLCAHPYDLATWLIAQATGVALYSAEGAELDGPTHPTAEVGWIGFANQDLAKRCLPILLEISTQLRFAGI